MHPFQVFAGRRHLQAMLLVAVGVFTCSAANTLALHDLGSPRAWTTGALLLPMMLQLSWRRATPNLAVACAAGFAGAVAGGMPVQNALAATMADMGQVLLMYSVAAPRFDRAAGRLRFAAWKFMLLAFGASSASALLYAGLTGAVRAVPVAAAAWVVGQVLAVQTAVVLLILWRAKAVFAIFRRDSLPVTALVLSLVLASAVAVFSQVHFPLLFLVFPFMVLATFMRGMSAAVFSLLLIEAVGIPLTAHGRGPLSLMIGATPALRMAMLQFFIFTSAATCYPVGRALNARRRLESQYRLLAYNSRDLITRGTLTGTRLFASPSITEMLGWLPAEVTNCPAVDLVHPEDRGLLSDTLERLCATGEPQEVVYRAMTKAGPPVWLEGHFRVVRNANNGAQQEYIATSRDVTERVVFEKELTAAYRELERLALLDGLTQVSNRRMFDETLASEWKRAQRDGSSVSLLMLDVDYFKLYNDTMGHPEGDACLRRIAAAMQAALRRTGDMVARYGGEEFAVLLPSTDADGAEHMARRIAEAIAGLALPHPGSPMRRVTCSIGVATEQPHAHASPQVLVAAADVALYDAKRSGRNQYSVGARVPRRELPQYAGV